jgi:hypothetical protein
MKYPNAYTNINNAITSNCNAPVEYKYIDYACAFLPDSALIRKCLSISILPLNNCVNYISSNDCISIIIDNQKIQMNLESCKLLHASGININIAYIAHDYESITYLINHMTYLELHHLATNYAQKLDTRYKCDIIHILVADKILQSKDKILIDSYINLTKAYYGRNIYNICNDKSIDKISILLDCYHIIKYMTHTEGLSFVTELTKEIDRVLVTCVATDNEYTNLCNLSASYKNMLEYHFRPRGSHTKSAHIMC